MQPAIITTNITFPRSDAGGVGGGGEGYLFRTLTHTGDRPGLCLSWGKIQKGFYDLRFTQIQWVARTYREHQLVVPIKPVN